MAKITISESQGQRCAEALEFSASFAAKSGKDKLSAELTDIAARIRHKIKFLDDKMRADGRRK